MAASPRELAQQDRWRIIGGWLQGARAGVGLSHADVVARAESPLTVRRLLALEAGAGEPSAAEIDTLLSVFGRPRADLDQHVQDQLLSLLVGSPVDLPALPTIVIVPPEEPQGEPADGLLGLVRLYVDSGSGRAEVTLSGRAIESLAQRRAMSALDCWQILARYIPSEGREGPAHHRSSDEGETASV